VPAVAQGPDAGDLAAPLDRAVGQRVEQDAAQVPAEHLGAAARAVVGLVEQDRAVPVEHVGGLAALVDDRPELGGEAGRGQRGLPVLLVQVELAALGAGVRRRIGLVDLRGDAVHVQDPGQRQAAEPGSDDRH
jgi:hypothetical protein